MAVAKAKIGKYGRSFSILPNKYSMMDSFKVEKAKIANTGEIFKFSKSADLSGHEDKLV